MAMKTTSAEIQAFYEDKAFWPDVHAKGNVWHEELILKVNGSEIANAEITDLKPNDQVSIVAGWVSAEGPYEADCSFETYFKRWRKLQNTVHLGVSVPKDKLEAVKAAIKAAGGSFQ